MPHPVHGAAARRDSKLLRIRRLTLWITGGAAAASLGLGTAFAHALPGHSYTTSPSVTSNSTSSFGQAEPAHTAQPPGTHHRIVGSRGQHAGHATTAHPRHQKLAAPAHAPAPAPSSPAPVVSSGGS